MRSEQEFVEPERYELHEGPSYEFAISRREFVQCLGLGVVLSVSMPSVWGQRAGAGDRAAASLAQRLHIAADGMITVLTSKVEVGQGSRTQLTQAAAEELRLLPARIRLMMGDTAGPDDGGTAGSRTTPATVPSVRRACASARQLLLEIAASTFSVSAQVLDVRDGAVTGLPPGRSFTYADLAGGDHAEALKRASFPDVKVSEVAQWSVLGTSQPRVGAIEMVTGAHRYPSDIVRPGLLYARVLRPPSYGAQLTSVDLTSAKALPGVIAFQDGEFVGLAAPTSSRAEEARVAAAKTATWKAREHFSNDELYARLRSQVSGRPRPDERGTPDVAFKAAHKTLRQTYQVAYIQHAPMEPRAAVAEWNGDELMVWTGSQQPARVRQDLAESLRIPIARVRVVVPDTGGGFGGKHSGEAAVEAARIAREAGKPVCLRWTREEEFTWAYFRPAGVIDVAGGLDDSGALIAWEQVNFNSGASAIGTPYAVESTRTEFKPCDQPLRSGSYRALASTANNFARESFMDELADVSGADPLEYRLRYLTNERLRAVLLAAAERFGWRNTWRRNTSPQPSGVGLACGIEKGSYVACCVRVEVDKGSGRFRVARIVEAFECGAIQNPANLQSQVEGCIVQGLGGAWMEETLFKDGRILNAGFGSYRVPRFRDVPEIETVLLNRPDLPSVGAGETPIIGVAPAIANALAHSLQQRIRSLPIRAPGLQGA